MARQKRLFDIARCFAVDCGCLDGIHSILNRMTYDRVRERVTLAQSLHMHKQASSIQLPYLYSACALRSYHG